MLIGIISDSHGEVSRTRSAMQQLADYGCTKFIHLGDVEIVEVLDELIGFDVVLVFGNCDWGARLYDYAVTVGIDVRDGADVLTVDGKRIAFLHGHDEEKYHFFLNDGVDYLLHGHTHEKRDEMVNKTRCINPGALHRAAVYTVAVLDPSADTLVFLEVE
ncbi:MAG: metallophosphoesterase family protein [Planctomycetes bacterium]|nr:metallophosphoesterase family protein [Planctomycetota bacterium]